MSLRHAYTSPTELILGQLLLIKMDIGQQSIIRIGGRSGSQTKDCSEAKVKEAKIV